MNAISTEMIFLWCVLASYGVIAFLGWRRARLRKTILDLALPGKMLESGAGRSSSKAGERNPRF
ncbi:MAG: hypothetical protein HQL53_05485 [Magnetococcales bacterium]|nr:hypothetical protein [Magnetococcales bacterium]